MILIAQSVPEASAVPCVTGLPAGWTVGGVRVRLGESRFWLDSDRAGDHAVEISLRATTECDVSMATEVPSDEPGLRRFERIEQPSPDLRATRTYLADGMCVTYVFDLDGDVDASTALALDAALSLQPRNALVDEVHRRSGLSLCGWGAPDCPGGSG